MKNWPRMAFKIKLPFFSKKTWKSHNKNGVIDAIPVTAYHDISDNKAIDSTDVNLFDQEMKYLHDNGFKVIPMSDIGYNENTKYMYIK